MQIIKINNNELLNAAYILKIFKKALERPSLNGSMHDYVIVLRTEFETFIVRYRSMAERDADFKKIGKFLGGISEGIIELNGRSS